MISEFLEPILQILGLSMIPFLLIILIIVVWVRS